MAERKVERKIERKKKEQESAEAISGLKMCIRVVACSKQMNASLLGYTIWVNSATLLNCTFYLVLAQYSSNYIAMSNISSTPLPILPLHRRSD